MADAIDMEDLHIEIACREPILIYDNDDAAQEYLYDRTIDGDVWLYDDEENKVGEVGKICLYIIDGNRAICDNEDIAEWCEEHSGDMYEYIRPMYRDGKIKKELCINKKNNNLLVFHWLEIYKEYRKFGLGDKIVKAVLRRYGDNCGAIVVLPYPLQYSQKATESKKRSEWMKKMKFTEFKTVDEKTAFKKVEGFWKRMGFKKVPYYDIYYYRGG